MAARFRRRQTLRYAGDASVRRYHPGNPGQRDLAVIATRYLTEDNDRETREDTPFAPKTNKQGHFAGLRKIWAASCSSATYSGK